MHTDLQKLTYSMFKDRFHRRNNNNEFTPYFYRYIGVNDVNNYDNILRTLVEKCNEHDELCIIFDNMLPLSGEMELIQYIYNELNTMNINNIANEDINIFDNAEINSVFLQALNYVISLAIHKENFFNNNVRNNFITKLIVWGYTYLRNINFYGDINPKCIYYGTIDRHDIYFLIILYLMNFDVIYINPLKEEYWDDIDSDKLSSCIKNMNILSIESLKERANKGSVIENRETLTKQIQREVEAELFTDTGMFKPWQFRNGYTKSVLLDTILEDIYIYWNEPAKLRHGFKVEGDTVEVPCLFMKIDGVNNEEKDYEKLLKYCISSQNTLFFNNGNISNCGQVTEEMYQLMFYQLSDGTYDIDEIKKLSIYKFGKYSEEVQNLLLRKFNDTILDKNIYVKPFDRETGLSLLVLVLSLSDKIVRLIDNFDFTANIPKIVIFLDEEDKISDSMLMLLGYLSNIGIDIVIFNPSGLLNISNILKSSRINTIRLEHMNYECKFKNLIVNSDRYKEKSKQKQKSGVLSWFLNM